MNVLLLVSSKEQQWWCKWTGKREHPDPNTYNKDKLRAAMAQCVVCGRLIEGLVVRFLTLAVRVSKSPWIKHWSPNFCKCMWYPKFQFRWYYTSTNNVWMDDCDEQKTSTLTHTKTNMKSNILERRFITCMSMYNNNNNHPSITICRNNGCCSM